MYLFIFQDTKEAICTSEHSRHGVRIRKWTKNFSWNVRDVFLHIRLCFSIFMCMKSHDAFSRAVILQLLFATPGKDS